MSSIRSILLPNTFQLLPKDIRENISKEEEAGEWKSKIKESDWNLLKRDKSTFCLTVTKKCNSDCKICFMGEEDFIDMSLDEIKYVLSKIGKNKIVILFGGEPTTREDLIEILEMIKNSGNFPAIYTNGLKFSDPLFSKKIKKYVKRIYFSFDGFSEEIYEKLRGDSKQLKTKLKALENLKNEKYEVLITTTFVPGINDGEVSNILNFVKENNFIKALNFISAVPYGKADFEFRTISGCFDILEKIREVEPNMSLDYFIEFKRFYLNIGRYSPKIRNRMNGYFCHTLFNIKNGKVEQLIKIEELKQLNKQLEFGNIFGIMKMAFKTPVVMRLFLKSVFYRNSFESSVLNENIFGVRVSELNCPINLVKNVKHNHSVIMKNSSHEFEIIASCET